jgi:murein DD-endopeptidase MepM/ murein hydrolase activator NlpD
LENALPNVIIGVRRALARLRPARPNSPDDTPSRSRDAAHPVTPLDRLRSVRRSDPAAIAETTRQASRRLAGSIAGLSGRERALPVAVAGLVVAASILSVAPTTGAPTKVDQTTPRIAIGGGVLGPAEVLPEEGVADPGVADLTAGDGSREALGAPANALAADAGDEPESFPMSQFLADGTLLKPIAVDPSVPDASERLQTYEVKAGDTLTGIANKFGVSMMTIWWANGLTTKDLKQSQDLIIPPVDGLVVTVKAGDTLDALAAAHKVEVGEIIAYNGLIDADLVVGQVLIVPGARGAAIATPTPKPTPKPTARPRTSSSGSSGSSGGGSAPSYSGGRLAWPMPGHRIIQYYRSGHHGLDIAAKTGDKVYSAAAGTVVYAGWKNNGGGYVVWVNHGNGLYTTYNHLSRVLVSRGQGVARGQAVGRAGSTGWAYGPHLHFEVTRGYPWANGRDNRVNPLAYY